MVVERIPSHKPSSTPTASGTRVSDDHIRQMCYALRIYLITGHTEDADEVMDQLKKLKPVSVHVLTDLAQKYKFFKQILCEVRES